MTDLNKAELRRLAEEAKDLDWVFDWMDKRARAVRQMATPALLLSLLDECDEYEAGLRAIACNLGAGGYNAAELSAGELLRKVNWGIDAFATSQQNLVDSFRAERDAALAERDQLREMSGCLDLLRRDLIEAGVIGDACPPMFMTEGVLGYIGQLRAELEACRKDAERYRWLRERCGVDFIFGDYSPWLPADGVEMEQAERDTTDASIDLAMAKEGSA